MSTPGKIFGIIPKLMNTVGTIGKNRKNSAQGYSFRGIEDMYNAIHPALTEHGVFCCPQVINSQMSEFETKNGGTGFRAVITVNHKFYADDGSFVEVITQGEGIDHSDKASNKAMSAAMKYAFIELLSIPTADVADSDKDTPEAGRSRGAPTGYQVKTANVRGFGNDGF